MGVNYGLNRVRFTSPVPVGSRVRARFTLRNSRHIEGNGVQVTWNTLDRSAKAPTSRRCRRDGIGTPLLT